MFSTKRSAMEMKRRGVPTPLPGLVWMGDAYPRLAPWATTHAPSGGVEQNRWLLVVAELAEPVLSEGLPLSSILFLAEFGAPASPGISTLDRRLLNHKTQ